MDIQEIAYNYKRQTASRYLPVNASELTSKIMEADGYSVSTKYDGHFYLLNYDGEKVTLVNHGGNIITDLPILRDALSLLSGKCNDITLAGELYLFKKDGRTRSFDLAAALDDKSPDIYFAAFDLLVLNGETLSLDIKSLAEKLNIYLGAGESLHAAKSSFVESRTEIAAHYSEIVENQGYEGIVVRAQDGPIYKIKPLITLDAVILGYAEGEGSRAGMLKEILVGLCVSENEFLLFTKVGTGYTEDQRKSLLKILEQHKVSSDYIEVSGANVAFTMIEPHHVVEFSCLDIFNENSSGAITKMCLQFTGGKYVASGNRPMASIIAPVFVQIRTDKKANTQDAGFSQITKRLSLDSVKSEDVTLAQSEILLREVYVKESKGMKMVRKFMVWKTNKEQTGQYPAYVYHYTDFSPGRAEMLAKEIKVSNSKQQVEEIFTAEVASNVKKGWEKA